MRTAKLMLAWLAAGVMSAFASDVGIDPARKHAWGENAGWVNAGPSQQGVAVHFDGGAGWLSGFAWAENLGWIKMGAGTGGPYVNSASNNWGVNMAASGKLSGYAWGENVGWINFGHPQCDVAVNPTNGQFTGHAWGENIGWLKFRGESPDYGVRTLAFDLQSQGTPNWWLNHYGVDELYDAGDGIAAWQKYVMDADPTATGDCLRITVVSNETGRAALSFTPSSTRRYYTLVRREYLTEGGWSNVTGQVGIVGVGGTQTLQDTNAAGRAFYTIHVSVATEP